MDNKKQIEAITKKLDLIRRVLNGDPSNHYRHYDWVDIDKANSEYDSYYIKLRDLKVANMSPQEQLAEAVKRYADANYSTGGWDYVSECYDTKEIVAMVEGCSTVAEAIAKVADETGCAILADRRADIQAEAF